jgi:hypothetical protein
LLMGDIIRVDGIDGVAVGTLVGGLHHRERCKYANARSESTSRSNTSIK